MKERVGRLKNGNGEKNQALDETFSPAEVVCALKNNAFVCPCKGTILVCAPIQDVDEFDGR
jgi:hypothetical protein